MMLLAGHMTKMGHFLHPTAMATGQIVIATSAMWQKYHGRMPLVNFYPIKS
ncbi:MAG: hypothetical protein SH820_10725 [Xanthomonadales bacterium]|nr:hypothetical protein [Xanthomonadales bacterium]